MWKSAIHILLAALLGGCSQAPTPPKEHENKLTVALEADPQSLDPRLARTLIETTVIKMLYEGLIRTNAEGKTENALAQNIAVSPDGKIYTVTLKDSSWSDGTPLTSDDFVATWKSMLAPSFPSTTASRLFPIKGARAAKGGLLPVDGIALRSLSANTFTFELDAPLANDTELLGTLPVHSKVRTLPPSTSASEHIYNGPFVLTDWKHHDRLTFAKNPRYHASGNVRLEGLDLLVLDGATALNLYDKRQIDWTGSPLGTMPQDAIPTLLAKGTLQVADACGTYWFRFNTARAPFDDATIRRAFNLALDREGIVKHITQGGQKVALGILPPALALHAGGFYEDNQSETAKSLFAAAAVKPTSVTICYVNNERGNRVVQAVQQQWEKAFGIPVTLQACEAKVSFDKLAKGDYQVMLGSWFADIDDPLNFLSVFSSKDNGMNNTGWEDPHYRELLRRAEIERNPANRQLLMAEAEEILMRSMPVAPLFHNSYNYIARDKVKGVYFSSLGYLDFRDAYIESGQEDL